MQTRRNYGYGNQRSFSADNRLRLGERTRRGTRAGRKAVQRALMEVMEGRVMLSSPYQVTTASDGSDLAGSYTTLAAAEAAASANGLSLREAIQLANM